MASVGDLLDEMDRERGVEPEQPKVAEPFTPAMLPDAPALPAPGIYFGMPEEEYHALPALSSHGVQTFIASPMLYWATATWLSEAARKREAEEAARQDVRTARTIGKAYHCRLLEGEEAYAARYAVALSPAECEGALESTDQIKAAIAAKDAKPVSKVPDTLPDGGEYQRAARKEDWIAQLLTLDPEAKVLARLQQAHAERHAGKLFIPADAHEQIEIAARMIEADDEKRHALNGGYPEVTLIWHCHETGVPMKARCDRLKLRAIVDLKSIANKGMLPLDLAIRSAVGSYHYNVQPSIYVEGVQAVRALLRDDRLAFAHNDSWTQQQYGEASAWCDKWLTETEEPEWWWLFQQKGIAPATRLVQYPLAGVTRRITDEIVRQAKHSWRAASEKYGTEPWLDTRPAYTLNDDDIPPRATENLRGE